MTKEQNFWKLIKKYLPGDVSRVENVADEGTPDVTGAFYNHDYWVELKVCKNEKKFRCPASLCGDSQLIWHLKREEQGSNIFLLVYYIRMKKIILYKYKNGQYKLIGNYHKVRSYNLEALTLDVKTHLGV